GKHMQLSRRDFLRRSGAATVALGMSDRLAWQPVLARQGAPLGDDACHLLNRITWGVRPEDMQRVAEIGWQAYLEEQLYPERIDDSEMDARLSAMPILAMDRRTAYRLVEREYR